MRILAWILAVLMAVGHGSVGAGEAEVPAAGSSVQEKAAVSRVKLAIRDGEFEESEGFGFRLSIEGWEARGTVAIVMVGPGGEKVTVVAQDDPLRLDETGLADIFIPYQFEGLSPGTWILVANSTKEIHTIGVRIPTVRRR